MDDETRTDGPRDPREAGAPRGERPRAGFATRAIHAGSASNRTAAITAPIWQSSTFRLASCAAGAELSTSEAPPEFYTRWGNPTLAQVEETLAALEGAEGSLVFASGMGAIAATVLALVSQGDHIVVGRSIYSGSHELARGILPRFGVEASFAEAEDVEALSAAIRPETRLILFESPSNPTLRVCDLEAIGALGRERGVLTLVDSTFATPWNQTPIALGVDIVVHAATKALGGHSDLTCGVVCSRRDVLSRIWPHLKLLGACLSPFEGWLLLRGLKTLALRAERQNASALAIARWLESRADVEGVHYPGLESAPDHALAARQMRGFGGILSFELPGSAAEVASFAESLELVTLAVSLGGAETLVQHPASMTHGMLPEAELRRAGIAPGLVRLSVGLEDADDIIADLDRALARR